MKLRSSAIPPDSLPSEPLPFPYHLSLSLHPSSIAMNRESSPTNHVSAAAASNEGIRPFDSLAFDTRGGGSSSSIGGYTSNGYPAETNVRLRYGSDSRDVRATSDLAGTDGMDGDPHNHVDVDADATLQEPPARRRPKNIQDQDAVPPVIDLVGERVREAFRDFLEK